MTSRHSPTSIRPMRSSLLRSWPSSSRRSSMPRQARRLRRQSEGSSSDPAAPGRRTGPTQAGAEPRRGDGQSARAGWRSTGFPPPRRPRWSMREPRYGWLPSPHVLSGAADSNLMRRSTPSPSMSKAVRPLTSAFDRGVHRLSAATRYGSGGGARRRVRATRLRTPPAR